MAQMMTASLDTGKNHTIYVNKKNEHDQYYFELEEWMRDSCDALRYLIAADNKESKYSMSSNKTALKYYNKGGDAMNENNYTEAALWFRKAVEEDSLFAFAWDNLGISRRYIGKYAEAIEAYNKSLSLDPNGATPLQNLPIVYQLLKDWDNALLSYKKLIAIYPDNAEGYYGAAQTYLTGKQDLEQSLDYMCKAYNIYTKQSSPYRADAQNHIRYIYAEMKKAGKEDRFNEILSNNNINTK